MAPGAEIRPGEIGQSEIRVRDLERATAFYRDVLGLPHLFSFTRPRPSTSACRTSTPPTPR